MEAPSIKSIGVIGVGNMGKALLSGFAKTQNNLALFASTRTPSTITPLIPLGVTPVDSIQALAHKSDLLLVCVKPKDIETVLAELAPALSPKTILLSIAAGIPLERLERLGCPAIRCMPNTPALVGQGVFAFAFGKGVDAAMQQTILDLFSPLGLSLSLPEAQFPAFSALLGAGPALVVTMMQGMVLAGIKMGFSQRLSRDLIDALFLGTAAWSKAQPETHLIALRDMVTSPKGLTIDGVQALEAKGFAGTTMEAVLACYEKAIAMEHTKK
ncbi:MAG: pyrroline-5-carboxylate reductase [Desulfovibrio sp.]|nr:pyrroline-5-carboxylate reductase [Desulfovibrio sp.]